MTSSYNKDRLEDQVSELQSLLRLDDIDHSDLVQHVEDFFAKDESALAYSLQRGIEGEDTLRSIVQLLVCIAVNIVSSESKVSDVVENLSNRSLIEDDVKALICRCVEAARTHSDNLSRLVDQHLQSCTRGNYLSSSVRFDRNIAQRSSFETEGPRHAAFTWRLRLENAEDVMLRVPIQEMVHLAKQMDIVSAEMNRSRRGQPRQLFNR